MDQAFQLLGAVLIVVAFAALQRDMLAPHSRIYLGLNLVGSVILTGVAIDGRDWGFLLLEVVWALVSAWGLLQVLRGRQVDTAH